MVSKGPSLVGYELWASQNGVGAGSANEDGDARNNLYEYALNGDPTTSDPGVDPTFVQSGTDFIYSHLQRDDDATLSYTVEVCTDLASDDWNTAVLTSETNDSGTANFYQITHAIETEGTTTSFIRLKIVDQ